MTRIGQVQDTTVTIKGQGAPDNYQSSTMFPTILLTIFISATLAAPQSGSSTKECWATDESSFMSFQGYNIKSNGIPSSEVSVSDRPQAEVLVIEKVPLCGNNDINVDVYVTKSKETANSGIACIRGQDQQNSMCKSSEADTCCNVGIKMINGETSRDNSNTPFCNSKFFESCQVQYLDFLHSGDFE
jgi:hypothetical protein